MLSVVTAKKPDAQAYAKTSRYKQQSSVWGHIKVHSVFKEESQHMKACIGNSACCILLFVVQFALFHT